MSPQLQVATRLPRASARWPLRIPRGTKTWSPAIVLVLSCVSAVWAESSRESIDFDRDIRPILSDTCYQCHGPDEAKRKADFRLDDPVTAMGAIEPGNAEASELYRRLTSTDESERMPPLDSGKSLSVDQIDVIAQWIRDGATWQDHWAFLPPQRHRVPRVASSLEPRSPVDHFVFARLSREELSPSPPANRTTLIRRLSLDLTGLPPTPTEVKTFLGDAHPDAYERLVDRLLASPRFGERMALPWLDAARYADTSGYQNDGPRYMWRWRDWLIQALNNNMPFDQFTLEQLAGDLLPEATLEQKIATGFNRNHRGNAEGGIIPEEYAVEYVVDRVETTATVWLGLTIGCARCHDHKFDPISQRDFFQFYAFFNNVPEFGRAIKEGNSPPFIKAPTTRQTRRLKQLEREVADAESNVGRWTPKLEAAQKAWEKMPANVEDDWTLQRGLVRRFPLDEGTSSEVLDDSHTPKTVRGKIGFGQWFDGSSSLSMGDVGDYGYFDGFSIAGWIRPDGVNDSTHQGIVSRVTETVRGTGYSLTWKDDHLHVNLVKRWLDDAIRVRSRDTLPHKEWSHICVTYDGSRTAGGVRLFVNGAVCELEVELDRLNQSFATPEPFRIGGAADASGFHGAIDDIHLFDRALSPDEVQSLAVAERVPELLRILPRARTSGQRRKLRDYFVARHASTELREAVEGLVAARDARDAYWESIPTVMVMQEAPQPRPTFVLQRGQYDRPQERVAANTPDCLPPMPESQPRNRLGLARWIVDPKNPLTARVAVNRYWQMLFGRGLVETPEDFGVQGTRPIHPRLLDWLATEFMRTEWNVKSLVRTIITSATYRQSSDAVGELIARDPQNRLLGRGPRFRLRAELVRDQALAASGLLVEELGGPSVRPYQPEGLWQEIASDKDYRQSTGKGLYRRSLYTYWKRTVAPPSMMTFDASSRETCVVRSTRTNTPLQALTLLNDVTFLEASRGLAQRVMNERASTEQNISSLFQRVVGRQPRAKEHALLLDGFRHYRMRYRNRASAAEKLVEVGELPLDPSLDRVDLAAYLVLSSLLLNLDETVTKE